MYVHMVAGACRGQKRKLGLHKLEIQVAVHHWTWALGTKLSLLKEQHTLLTTKSSLQPFSFVFFHIFASHFF